MQRTRWSPAWFMGLAATGFLSAFLFLPLGAILLRSLDDPAALLATAGNPYYWQRLGFTAGQALLSTALTLLLGIPAAVLFARYAFPGKRLLRSAFTIPFVMPSVVTGIGFLALIGPRGVTGMNLQGSFAAILLAHVFYNYAVVVRVVGSYLEAVAPRLEEAARSLGAGPWRSFWRVTLPLARPAILAAASLVFLFTFTSFGVILILAPAPRFATLEVEIYRLTARMLELNAAALLVMVQLVLVMLVTWTYARWARRLAVPLASGPRPLPSPQWGARLLLGANLLLAAILILSPLLALAGQALWRPGELLPTLDGFRALANARPSIGFPGAAQVIFNSLRFALISTGLALVIGFAFAYAVVRGGWRWLDAASLLPLATSAVSLGFGYLLVFPQVTLSALGISLAHALIGFPFVARSLLPALRALPPSLTAAARTLGAGPLTVLRRVELPLLTPALVTASSFAFAISMGEFGATLILGRKEYATIPVAIFDRLGRPGEANYAAALTLALLLMLITAAAMLLLERFGEGEL